MSARRIVGGRMELNLWIHVFIGLLTVASKLNLGEGRGEGMKDLPIWVSVPTYIREGETAILKCQHDLDDDKLYTMKWYKGAQEFYRFTPKESPSIKTFPITGLQIDSLSNSSVLALSNVDLNMTGRYTCEVTKDFPDFITAVKTSMMNVVAVPHHKPVIRTERKSVSIGDTFSVNCSSFRSKPVANITWLLNGFPVRPLYLMREVKVRELDKESITVGLNFTVRQHDFIKSRMTLTCQAKIEPGMYFDHAEIVIVEHDRPKISSVVDNYSSLPSGGGKSDNRISASGSPQSTCTAVPLAQLFLALLTLTTRRGGPLFVATFFSSVLLLLPYLNYDTRRMMIMSEDS